MKPPLEILANGAKKMTIAAVDGAVAMYGKILETHYEALNIAWARMETKAAYRKNLEEIRRTRYGAGERVTIVHTPEPICRAGEEYVRKIPTWDEWDPDNPDKLIDR